MSDKQIRLIATMSREELTEEVKRLLNCMVQPAEPLQAIKEMNTHDIELPPPPTWCWTTTEGARSFELHQGDCLEIMSTMPDNSVDAIVTDPPYELGFMGKGWDKSGIANSVEMWREALRVLKPGGHLLAFSGSRTYHRMVCAIEDAGFEIRDQIMWLYGSGFPKSLDVSKAIDKAAGAEREVIGGNPNHRAVSGVGYDGVYQGGNTGSAFITAPATDAARQWQGWGTALKPAHEPICVARKPLVGTVTANVLEYGTGALNIDGCRVSVSDGDDIYAKNPNTKGGFGHAGASVYGDSHGAPVYNPAAGRWPANVIHDGSEEVVAGFPNSNGSGKARTLKRGKRNGDGFGMSDQHGELRDAGTGSAARFFYCAKASKCDRDEGLEGRNYHPTVKPTALMRYLVRLVTPPGGIVLDPFMGSGSTGKAAMLEGFRFVGIDMTPEYVEIAQARIQHAATSRSR